ncbi:hypothetical protein [Parvibaculum sp.]|uniref:hypothetical protein n=1 Tax=Parvibaculum sp. TaxID=2024848 RepID=UPI001B2796B1|nr:hypothetical protein [Parvibaculum sp.]MBO6666923.1 hypothetical protein [Parvibaculum sp.]MBO6691872.1 hypothetical protein [Parvibaculum sp.]MBO6713544.1 hypothetical protein [Parvibaculum sp.]
MTESALPARPSTDRIDAFFTHIAEMPRGKRVAAATALFALYAVAFFSSFMIALAGFAAPGWIVILDKAPLLLPLAFIAGPALLFFCAYMQIRLNLWRAGETRARSHARLLLRLAAKLGILALCGHVATAGVFLARADHDLAASLAFIAAFYGVTQQGLLSRTDPLALKLIAASLFPAPEPGEKDERLMQWGIFLGIYLPVWIGLYVICLLT